jgi:transcriptional regulator with XRE-family HTH domain
MLPITLGLKEEYIMLLISQISPRQIRAARSLLGVNRKQLARQCGLSFQTLGLVERSDHNATIGTLSKIVGTLEAQGIRFTGDGVLLQKSPGDQLEGTAS